MDLKDYQDGHIADNATRPAPKFVDTVFDWTLGRDVSAVASSGSGSRRFSQLARELLFLRARQKKQAFDPSEAMKWRVEPAELLLLGQGRRYGQIDPEPLREPSFSDTESAHLAKRMLEKVGCQAIVKR